MDSSQTRFSKLEFGSEGAVWESLGNPSIANPIDSTLTIKPACALRAPRTRQS
jgi:hypothetical protein